MAHAGGRKCRGREARSLDSAALQHRVPRPLRLGEDGLPIERGGARGGAIIRLRAIRSERAFVTATTALRFGYLLSRGIAKGSRVLEQWTPASPRQTDT